jgi:hypothetical protein
LVGDVCYFQNQLISDSFSGVNINHAKAKATYNKFKALSKTCKLVFLPSHDKEAGKRLKAFIPLSIN